MLFKIIINVRNFPLAGYLLSKTQDCASLFLNHPSIMPRPFHRRQGVALQQVLRKLEQRTANQKAGFWAVFSDSKQDFSQKPGCFAQVLWQQYHTAEPNIGISNQDEIRKSYN